MKEQVGRFDGRPPDADPYGAAARSADELARLLRDLGDGDGAAAVTRAARQALLAAADVRVRKEPGASDLY